MAPKRKRVLSGMRPTGRLHIGHYFGALQNWVRLQDEHDCFYFVADWHALTTDYADASRVRDETIEIGKDWLAAGLDPAKCTMFVQSWVPEHAELHLILSMVTPLSWLERVPTYKEQLENIKDKDLHTYGFLGYPLLQTADIVIYDADFVPVGEDQAPHVELSREIVRAFNSYYGLAIRPEFFRGLELASFNEARLQEAMKNPFLAQRAREVYERRGRFNEEDRVFFAGLIRSRARAVGLKNLRRELRKASVYFDFKAPLVEPGVLLTETPRLPGTDGRKMSKSYNNTILLGEDPASIREKVRGMMTDPQRVRRTDPGRPEVCPVFAWHKLFSPPETIARVDRECRTAEIGCVDCKALMAEGLVKWIEPIRARRQEYEAHPDRVREILEEGSKKARKVTKRTMRRVREAIFGKEARRSARPHVNSGAGM